MGRLTLFGKLKALWLILRLLLFLPPPFSPAIRVPVVILHLLRRLRINPAVLIVVSTLLMIILSTWTASAGTRLVSWFGSPTDLQRLLLR